IISDGLSTKWIILAHGPRRDECHVAQSRREFLPLSDCSECMRLFRCLLQIESASIRLDGHPSGCGRFNRGRLATPLPACLRCENPCAAGLQPESSYVYGLAAAACSKIFIALPTSATPKITNVALVPGSAPQ